jgi:hypothetical protein
MLRFREPRGVKAFLSLDKGSIGRNANGRIKTEIRVRSLLVRRVNTVALASIAVIVSIINTISTNTTDIINIGIVRRRKKGL